MTPISNMDLPDEVVEKAAAAIAEIYNSTYQQTHLKDVPFDAAKAAIRAALQAMQDNGMAVVTYDLEPQGTTFVKKPRLTIRLDADERKPEEQR